MSGAGQEEPALSEEEVHRLLARAVELDAEGTPQTDLCDLRAAAVEAGIHPEAFDQAAKEFNHNHSAVIPSVSLGSPHSARVIHRVLLGGLLLISILFMVIALDLHGLPLVPAGDTADVVGYVLAACAIMTNMLALIILRRRVPLRSSSRDDKSFWPVAFGPVISLWVVIEGSGIIGAVGWLLTGSLASMLAVVFAISCLGVLRPSHFENT